MEVHEAPLFGPLLGLKTVKWENSNCTRAVSNIKEGQNHPLEEYLVSNESVESEVKVIVFLL
jgi:hypothetical protein